jgi:RND family efflux transporter MFP subunit
MSRKALGGSLFSFNLWALLIVAPPASGGAKGEKPGRIVLEQAGYIVPTQQVTISPRVPGTVVKLPIQEGQVVRAGDVLAQLDPSAYEIALRQAQARLALAKARYEKSKAAPQKDDLLVARAEVEVAQAEVERCRWRLDATVIRAPITGTILSKKVEEGNLVHPRGFNVSAAICEMADLSRLEVEVAVGERDIKKVTSGQACLVHVDANPKVIYQAQVVRLMPVADRAKGTVSVRVRLALKREDLLRPESRAVVQFLASP